MLVIAPTTVETSQYKIYEIFIKLNIKKLTLIIFTLKDIEKQLEEGYETK